MHDFFNPVFSITDDTVLVRAEAAELTTIVSIPKSFTHKLSNTNPNSCCHKLACIFKNNLGSFPQIGWNRVFHFCHSNVHILNDLYDLFDS